jgi:hypothetical protein
MPVLTTIRLDPFNPVLKAGTPSLHVTAEQDLYIKEILDICCSDSAFAKKAYKAISIVLTTGVPGVAPVISTLVPTTTLVGESTLAVVTGTGFFADSVVLVNGLPVATTFVSDTEVNFLPDVSVAGSFPISVQNIDGLSSNIVNFDVV